MVQGQVLPGGFSGSERRRRIFPGNNGVDGQCLRKEVTLRRALYVHGCTWLYKNTVRLMLCMQVPFRSSTVGLVASAFLGSARSNDAWGGRQGYKLHGTPGPL